MRAGTRVWALMTRVHVRSLWERGCSVTQFQTEVTLIKQPGGAIKSQAEHFTSATTLKLQYGNQPHKLQQYVSVALNTSHTHKKTKNTEERALLIYHIGFISTVATWIRKETSIKLMMHKNKKASGEECDTTASGKCYFNNSICKFLQQSYLNLHINSEDILKKDVVYEIVVK